MANFEHNIIASHPIKLPHQQANKLKIESQKNMYIYILRIALQLSCYVNRSWLNASGAEPLAPNQVFSWVNC